MIKKSLYFGNPTYLSTNNEQLIIKIPEVTTVPLKNITREQVRKIINWDRK